MTAPLVDQLHASWAETLRPVGIIEFTVRGTPVTQGSPTAYIVGKGDKAHAQVVSGAKGQGSTRQKLAWWRSAVRAAAVAAIGDRDPIPAGTALAVEIEFILARPAAHFRTNGMVKPSAPRHPAKRPDVGKLARAVEDSMSAVVYADDCQIVDLHPVKVFGSQPGCRVRVSVLP